MRVTLDKSIGLINRRQIEYGRGDGEREGDEVQQQCSNGMLAWLLPDRANRRLRVGLGKLAVKRRDQRA